MATKMSLDGPGFLRILFYGDPGSTKTRTACSAALDDRLSPALYLNASGNPQSVRDYERVPDVINIEDLADLNGPYDWILRGQPKNSLFCQKFELNPPYKTLIVDQVTDVQRIAFNLVVGASSKPGDIPPKREWPHYNKVLMQMVNFAKLYYSLPIHVIMCALERADRDETTGALKYAPLLEGQSAREVPGYALLVARLVHKAQLEPKILKLLKAEEEEIVSMALFRPSGSFLAKNQYGGLGTYMVNPTMTKILDGIEAHRKEVSK